MIAMVFLLLMLAEVSLVLVSFRKKSNIKREKAIVRTILFILLLILIWSPMIEWGFTWMMLAILLGMQALFALLSLVRKQENRSLRKNRMIFGLIGRLFLLCIAIFPLVLFPPYEPIQTSGEYSVSTKSYTWTDEARKELFTEEVEDNRKVTVQFWYPSKPLDQKYPLVVFSHGAFGLRSSNYSAFQELASNGYVVASIDHTYHAFMTQQVDGERILTNMDFMNDAIKASNGEIQGEELYVMEQEWMKLRTEDMTFVMDTIKNHAAREKAGIFQLIDLDHIGVFGHSLGGATAAQMGRIDEAVDAVIVLDGTMLGEVTGFEEGKELVTDEPYPKPLLNVYNQSHYEDGVKGNEEYPNTAAYHNGVATYQVVIKGSEHMNFTDLPMVSPILSHMLGTGKVDARDCIELTNEVILEFFDHYLKASNLDIERERVF